MQSGDYPDTALAFAGIPHDRGHRADPRRGPAACSCWPTRAAVA